MIGGYYLLRLTRHPSWAPSFSRLPHTQEILLGYPFQKNRGTSANFGDLEGEPGAFSLQGRLTLGPPEWARARGDGRAGAGCLLSCIGLPFYRIPVGIGFGVCLRGNGP